VTREEALSRWQKADRVFHRAEIVWRAAVVDRARAIAALREVGMSLSEIAAATGLDRAQATRLVAKGSVPDGGPTRPTSG
jgi:lambda repressor-like predicted transcriptional regulator